MWGGGVPGGALGGGGSAREGRLGVVGVLEPAELSPTPARDKGKCQGGM